MAELGKLFAGSSESSGEKKVEVEMLDYGYISDCKDWSLMSAIVEVLKSGKEGHYPDVSFKKRYLLYLLVHSHSLCLHT
jgi:hypothetical protein